MMSVSALRRLSGSFASFNVPSAGVALGVALFGRLLSMVTVVALCVSLLLPSATAIAQEEKITLNMNNADIRAVIQWVAEQTRKNFVVDPRVKGRISVLSSEPMTRDEAYQVFLTALDVYGFAAVESGNNVKVIPNAQARSAGLPLVEAFAQADDDAQLVMHVIKVSNIPATEVVTILRPLVPQTGHLGAFPSSNSVLIADRATNIKRLSQLIKHIDATGNLDIEVVPLENATAQDVISVLTPLLAASSGAGAGAANRPQFGVVLASDQRSNSILMTGDYEKRAQVRDLIKRMDRPLSGTGNTQVVYLNYIDAAELVPILKGMTGSIKEEGKDIKLINSDVSIEASETTNALVITAPPSLLETLTDVISKLDIRRSQVLIEAVIVDVNERLEDELGVLWATSSNASDNDGIGAINFSTGSALGAITSGAEGLASAAGGLTFGYFRNGSIRALVSALASDTETNILSTPSLVTLDNEEAEIVVGRNVPFITGTSTSAATPNSNPFTTIQREDVGITLAITPKINSDDSMTLEVTQEVESVNETAVEGATDLVTDKRSIKTQVLVSDGEILVLGGLLEETTQLTRSKVPLLGDIPLLGMMFRNSNETTEQRNLMVFIKPTILGDNAKAREVTKQRYESVRGVQADFGRQRSEERHGSPVLPPFEVHE